MDCKFVICINNTDYPASLEQFKVYQVLDDYVAQDDGLIRIIDESGEDYLFPLSYFSFIELPVNVKDMYLKKSA